MAKFMALITITFFMAGWGFGQANVARPGMTMFDAASDCCIFFGMLSFAVTAILAIGHLLGRKK